MTKSERSGSEKAGSKCPCPKSPDAKCLDVKHPGPKKKKARSEHPDPNRPGRISWMCPKRPGSKPAGSKRPLVKRTGPKRP